MPPNYKSYPLMLLLKIKDAGVCVEVNQVDQEKIELIVRYSVAFDLSLDMVFFSFSFTKVEFQNFVSCLNDGTEGKHGENGFWLERSIYIKKPNHPYMFRDLQLVNRFFIVGPVSNITFTKVIVEVLNSVKV